MSRITSLMLLWGLAGIRTLTAAVHPGEDGAQPDPAGGGQQSRSTANETPTPEGSMWSFLFPLLILVAFMYFVMIRPQKKEQQKRQQMLSEVKVGEKVVTIGGMHGTVRRRGEQDVDLEVADGVVMTFNVGAIHERIDDQTKKE